MSAEDRAFVFIVGFTFYLLLQDLYLPFRVAGAILLLVIFACTFIEMMVRR
jgi:hypothetical protein